VYIKQQNYADGSNINVLLSDITFYIFLLFSMWLEITISIPYAVSYVFVKVDPAEIWPHCSKLHKE